MISKFGLECYSGGWEMLFTQLTDCYFSSLVLSLILHVTTFHMYFFSYELWNGLDCIWILGWKPTLLWLHWGYENWRSILLCYWQWHYCYKQNHSLLIMSNRSIVSETNTCTRIKMSMDNCIVSLTTVIIFCITPQTQNVLRNN